LNEFQTAIKLAHHLDATGNYHLADEIDHILIKYAQNAILPGNNQTYDQQINQINQNLVTMDRNYSNMFNLFKLQLNRIIQQMNNTPGASPSTATSAGAPSATESQPVNNPTNNPNINVPSGGTVNINTL